MSSLIINFEQVIEPFLVLNIFSLFSYQWLIALFTRVLLRVTVYYYYVTYASEAVVNSCSVKKAFLEISQNSQKKETLTQAFSSEFCDIFKNFLSYRTPPVAVSDISE